MIHTFQVLLCFVILTVTSFLDNGNVREFYSCPRNFSDCCQKIKEMSGKKSCQGKLPTNFVKIALPGFLYHSLTLNNRYANFIQAQEQLEEDMNIEQGSMFYIGNKNVS